MQTALNAWNELERKGQLTLEALKEKIKAAQKGWRKPFSLD